MLLISTTDLAALAGWSAGFAGAWAWCRVRDEVSVSRTLCALAAACVDVMSGWARHTRRAGGSGAEGTGPAPGGHPVDSVAHRDGVDPRHVVHIPTHLRGSSRER